mmetsp:Transcript_3525/g.22174  ORF Transcript_3525/g.22174 Transcript_3525/m.22174 type:complete len:273 (+) Transcript_3525:1284-2102(+)
MADGGSPRIEPHNGVMQRSSGLLVPHQGSFTLVGDSHRFDVHVTQFFHGFRNGAFDAHFGVIYQQFRFVFHPSGSGHDLSVFDLVRGHHVDVSVEQHEPRGLCPLVDGAHQRLSTSRGHASSQRAQCSRQAHPRHLVVVHHRPPVSSHQALSKGGLHRSSGLEPLPFVPAKSTDRSTCTRERSQVRFGPWEEAKARTRRRVRDADVVAHVRGRARGRIRTVAERTWNACVRRVPSQVGRSGRLPCELCLDEHQPRRFTKTRNRRSRGSLRPS